MLIKSAKVCLCLAFRGSVDFVSGMTRSGGTVPTRSRAFALTALTMEKRRFFGFGMECFLVRGAFCGELAGYEILYLNRSVRTPSIY